MASPPSSPTLWHNDENSVRPVEHPPPASKPVEKKTARPVTKPWTEDEELVLFKAAKAQFENDMTSTTVQFWQAVSEKMAEKGVTRSASSCDNRFTKFKSSGHFLHANWKELQKSTDACEKALGSRPVVRTKKVVSSVESTFKSSENLSSGMRWSSKELEHLLDIVSTYKTKNESGKIDWAEIARKYNSNGYSRSAASLKVKWQREHGEEADSMLPSMSTAKDDTLDSRKRRHSASLGDHDRQSRYSKHAKRSKPRNQVPKIRALDGGHQARFPIHIDTDSEDDLEDSIPSNRPQPTALAINRLKIVPADKPSVPAQSPYEQTTLKDRIKKTRKEIAARKLDEKMKKETLRRHDFAVELLNDRLQTLQREKDDLQEEKDTLREERITKEAALTTVKASLEALRKEELSLQESLESARR